jgi:hypothetical protein
MKRICLLYLQLCVQIGLLVGFTLPSWALDCNARLAALRPGHVLTSVLSDIFGRDGLTVQHPEISKNEPKNILFEEVSSWGRGENANQLFRASLRVRDRQEGIDLFKLIVRELDRKFSQFYVVNDSTGHPYVEGILEAHIFPAQSAQTLPPTQGPLEVQIALPQSEHETEVAQELLLTLKDVFHLKHDPDYATDFSAYDLNTRDGRREWGQAAFRKWHESLSYLAKKALQLISGADYTDILPYLRTGKRGWSKISNGDLNQMIDELDLALKSGHLPQNLVLYRAVGDSAFDAIWNDLKKTDNVSPTEFFDGAYTFTSIDLSFVEFWNQSKLGGKGIILDIHTPKGTSVGHVDRGQYERDYAEIIFPRNKVFKAVRAYTDEKGQRRLVVQVE